MNKNNFQVGDYCRHADGTIAIVAKVEKDRGFACKIGNSEYLWSYNNRFEPIPLTPDILGKNGFDYKERSTSNALIVKHGDGYVVEVFMFKNGWVFNIERNYFINEEYATDRVHKCGIYVHELQRALRCVELWNLADNFKI